MNSKSFYLVIDRYADPDVCFEYQDVRLEIEKRKTDCSDCPRLWVRGRNFDLELLPTKGLTLGQCRLDGHELFWEPPIGLIDPDELDLTEDGVYINSQPAPGFEFLKTFAGSVELYGLRNWGMPKQEGSKVLPLHGETSNIPVHSVRGTISDNRIEISGAFVCRSFEGNDDIPWYERGTALFQVIRTLFITPKESKVRVIDNIINIRTKQQLPDWGYHITLRPQPGSRLIVPSGQQFNRSGGELPRDFETWQPAVDDKIRTETGIIHRNLEIVRNEWGERVYCRLLYPDGRTVKIGVPHSPYMQTWFCSGGANSTEFTHPDGTPLFRKNWDGQGLEIGVRALDHDGNTDPEVPPNQPLEPQASLKIVLEFEVE